MAGIVWKNSVVCFCAFIPILSTSYFFIGSSLCCEAVSHHQWCAVCSSFIYYCI